jgi:Peptidase M15
MASMKLPTGETVTADQRIIETIPLTWGEMTKGCSRVPASKQIVQNIHIITREFGEIREKAGCPLIITSGYRPPAVNRAIGGASRSQHIQGLAIDLKPAPGGITLDQLWQIIRSAAKTGGIGDGRKRGFIHRDRRPNNSVIYFGY